jgi:NAD-dependent deacetylase
MGEAARALRRASQVVVFSGAGVSLESGIPTFRDGGGLWERFPPERFATAAGLAEAFSREPSELAAFVGEVLLPVANARPNPAHLAIAALERRRSTVVVTQNVDGLHQEAGSTEVKEIHGSLFDIRSSWGGLVRRLDRQMLEAVAMALSRVQTGVFPRVALLAALRPLVGASWRGLHRPSVVLFGEALKEPDWEQAQRDVGECDLMLVVGTSGLVEPAASLPGIARRRGATLVSIDPRPETIADIYLAGPAGELLPRLLEEAFPGG